MTIENNGFVVEKINVFNFTAIETSNIQIYILVLVNCSFISKKEVKKKGEVRNSVTPAIVVICALNWWHENVGQNSVYKMDDFQHLYARYAMRHGIESVYDCKIGDTQCVWSGIIMTPATVTCIVTLPNTHKSIAN